MNEMCPLLDPRHRSMTYIHVTPWSCSDIGVARPKTTRCLPKPWTDAVVTPRMAEPADGTTDQPSLTGNFPAGFGAVLNFFDPDTRRGFLLGD